MVSDNLVLISNFLIFQSLNPYSDGRWFLIIARLTDNNCHTCLNPYSDGRWFLIKILVSLNEGLIVLILILMEDGF